MRRPGRRTRLVAVLDAGGEAAGLARPGQTILLRLDAFPYEQFGLQKATISEASRALVSDSASSSRRTSASSGFLIYAKLGKQFIQAGNTRYVIKPGMTVSGELLLNRKSIASWLLGPAGQFAASVQQ